MRRYHTITPRWTYKGEGLSPEIIAANMANLITRTGTIEKALETTMGENAKLREDKRKLREELDGFKSRVPKEGDLVLTGADIAEYEELKALGKAADLKKRLEEAAKLETEVKGIRNEEIIRKAAESIGANPVVLGKLLDAENVSIRDIQVADEKGALTTKQIAVVKTESGEKALMDHLQANFADFMPALQKTPTGEQNPGIQSERRPYPAIGGGDKTPPVDVVDAFLKRVEEDNAKSTNPLLAKS